jgi:RNA polymerase sigma-70 factor (ECF subfamily)
MHEQKLIDLLRTGSESAFQQLLNTHKNKVINTCFKFLLSKEDAEDIAQEVFIEVFQSIKEFRGDASLNTWIYRIAVTKSLDEIKKRKRKKRITSLGKLIGLEKVAEYFAGNHSADFIVDQKEQIILITQALDKLPDSQRIAYTLSKVDGFTNQEIAQIMDTNISSIESLIKRAKKKTIEELTKQNKII